MLTYNQTRRLDKVMLGASRHRAKVKGIEFNIDLTDIVIPEFCPVFGYKLEVSNRKGGTDNSPTLDRIDNSKGYIKGNVAVISKRANTCKTNLSIEGLERLLKYMKGEL